MPRAGWLAGGSVAAAVLSTVLPVDAPVLVAGSLAAAAVGICAALLRQPKVACAAVGAAIVIARIGVGAWLSPTPTVFVGRQSGHWFAQVASISPPARGEQRAVLDVHRRMDGGAPAALGFAGEDAGDTLRVYATLPRYPTVAPGDRFTFDGRLLPRPDSAFGEYLATKGIAATADVRDIAPAQAEDGPALWLEQLRRGAGDALARTLPEPQAGLAAGILIGLRDRVSREVAAAFTTSGLSHIVAISGWNIAIVGAVVGGLLRGRERRLRSLVVGASIVIYTMFAGASPSVVRAALMAGTTLLARESGRRGAAATALGLAAFGLLVIDPETVKDAGYQLSVAATAGLLCWSGPIGQVLLGVAPRSPQWLRESLAVSLAAQAATLPLVLLAFGRLALIAPFANLVVAPLVAPAMLFGLIALGAGVLVGAGAPAVLGVAIAGPASALLGLIVWAAELSARVPLASVELEAPWSALAAAAAAVVLLAASSKTLRGALRSVRRWISSRLAVHERRRAAATARARRVATAGATAYPRPVAGSAPAKRADRAANFAVTVAIAAALAILSLVVPAFTSAGGARLSMTVMDIGQGDAILLEGPHGGRILVDGGPDPDRLLSVLDSRLPAWDRRLDLVVLTHPHEDHVAGLPLLLKRYRIGAFAEPGMRGPGPGYRAFAQELHAEHRADRTLAAGDHLTLDGAEITVRWPRRGKVPLDPPDDGKGINNVSIVLDLQYGARRFLLTGDIEQEIDPQLLLDGLGGRPVDVLKVPHHGSGTATTDALLAALRPRVAIVSAGVGNPYGHPNRRTLDRIAASGARVLRTDRDGSVTVTSDGSDLRVTTAGPRPVALTAALQVPQPAAWTCGLPGATPAVPTISGWQSPIASSPPRSSTSSVRRTGSSRTWARSRRSPPFSHSGSRAPGVVTTASSLRPPPFFTTSTSSSIRTTDSPVSSTATAVPAG